MFSACVMDVCYRACRASWGLCNKNHLLHLVGILFPHINVTDQNITYNLVYVRNLNSGGWM